MKKKVLEISVKILIILLLMILIIFSYYTLVDIETQEPKVIEAEVNIEVKQYKGRKVFIATHKDEAQSDLKILYFHGGSYVAEATNEHWDFIEKLVLDTGATVILPDYPLTPKHNYEDVFEMVDPLYREIVEKVDSKNLIVMGDSAGGGLGLALIEKVAKENVVIPEKTILISPWLDVRLTNPEIEEVQKMDKKLNKETLKLAGIAYAGEDGINSYLVNPIDGDLSKLKNVTIFTGTNDILNPDVYVLQEKAKKVNVNIEVKEYENAEHIWLINNSNTSSEVVEQAYNDLLEIVLK